MPKMAEQLVVGVDWALGAQNCRANNAFASHAEAVDFMAQVRTLV
jgi:hypothetical protein